MEAFIHSIPDRPALPLPPNSLCGIIPHPPFAHVQVLEQSMSLTKSQIVEALFAKNIFTRTESAQVIDTLFELIKQSLQNGEDVLVSGFGRFSVKGKYQRIGRNPQTGQPMTLPAKKVVTFKCSDVLRAAMNGRDD